MTAFSLQLALKIPLNNLPSVYTPTVVKLLLSDPSSRTGVIKAEQRGQLQPWDVWQCLWSQRVDVGRLVTAWTQPVQPGSVPTHGTHSSAFQEWAWACAVSVEWAAKPGLARGFAGLWGNGVRSPLAAFLPLTQHIAGVCGSLRAGTLGPPCRTGPKASESPSAHILARDAQRRGDNS